MSGALAAIGISFSGMVSVKKSLAFFDFFSSSAVLGGWDASMLFAFAAALLINVVLYPRIYQGGHGRPVFAAKWSVPKYSALEGRLVVGGVLFGVGWATGGMCPGPAVIGLASGAWAPFLFTTAMFLGFFFMRLQAEGVLLDPALRREHLSRGGTYAYLGLSLLILALPKALLTDLSALGVADAPSNYALAALGGLGVGGAAALLLWLDGRIMGLAGLFAGLISPFEAPAERLYRASFTGGFLGGALLMRALWPAHIASTLLPVHPLWTLIGGLLVGVGTVHGAGCTSGHGICGNARLSPRSMLSTATFFGSAIIASYFWRLVSL